MRTLRLSLAGTVIAVLLGGLGSAVLAQDEDSLDPMRASKFTGTWGEVISEVPMEDWAWMPGPPGSFESLDNETIAPFEASDPRISGTWTQVLDMRTFIIDEAADIWAPVWSGVVRIENEEGAWSGPFDGFFADSGHEWYRLEGEGAYEGLLAVLRWAEEGDLYEGVIIPGVPPDYPAQGAPGGEEAAAAGATVESSVPGATEEPAVESDAGPEAVSALVTGTEVCTGGEIETTRMEGYNLLHATGPEGHCTITASDPRVSGPSSEGDMWDACFLMGPDDPPFYPSGCIYWGDYGIEGPDGDWVGTWTGVDDVGLGQASYLILLEGTGAYEGWSFVGHWLDPFTGAPLTFSGLIYEGPLPPWEPPAE